MKNNRKSPLSEKAYKLIKRKIVLLEFKPGMKLEEKDLISEIGIGRTPIREAVKILTSEGLIVSYGTNSTYVKDLSLKTSKDLLSLLYCLGDVIFDLANPKDNFSNIIDQLEMLFQKMADAIQKREYSESMMHNTIFHKTLAKIANNEYLDTLFEKLFNEEMRLTIMLSLYLWDSVERLHGLTLEKYYDKLQIQHREHIELLKAKDFEGLKNIYKEHMKLGQINLVNYFQR
jgi:GntR family transcriptional regulator, rspAB operon transcriptional repressor